LVEVLIVVGIIMTLAAIAVPLMQQHIYLAKVHRAIGDIITLQLEIDSFQSVNGRLPDSLDEIQRGNWPDPWGNPYQYLNFALVNGKGQMRKDRFLVPLNSTYDLYSMGQDGASVPPITAKVSQDDIIRINDGAYVGLASQF
jgi:general secretion pathway protein G